MATAVIYLDTHVVLWLYEGLLKRFSKSALRLLEDNDLLISPIVKLELQFLHEVKRSTRSSEPIVNELGSQIGLAICDIAYEEVVNKAIELNWTRDPFDRLIVANALCRGVPLLTKDRNIRRHSKLAIWT